MSRFSHRQPVWTFGTVVLLSTLLLSPVAASVVLRALVQMAPGDRSIGAGVPGRTAADTPLRRDPAGTERLSEQPRRTEEESSETSSVDGEQFHPSPEPDLALSADVSAHANTLGDIALLLPTRIIVTVPDDLKLGILPPSDDFATPKEDRSLSAPRAPPVQV